MNLVRIVYLSPSDKPFVAAYSDRLTDSVYDLQRWFADRLDGQTFALPDEPVVWFQTSNPSAWYEEDPLTKAGGSKSLYWTRVLDDAFALTGAAFNQPDARWIFYIDAFPACDQLIGGTSGIALNGANDLRGLNGESFLPPCPGEPVWKFKPGRWIGGLAHELGHALGLDHPADSPGGADDRCLMYQGYLDYPDTYLRPEERDALLRSGFFNAKRECMNAEHKGDEEFHG